MLICYLDDSYAESASVITLAGYVATEDAWKKFEVESGKLYSSFNIDVLHAREFEQSKKCFDKWSEVKKVAFMIELGEIMGVLLKFGISRSVVKENFKIGMAGRKKEANLSAYGFAFESILFALNDAKEFGTVEEVRTNGISFRVEEGHKNNNDLKRIITNKIQENKLNEATSISFIKKTSCRAIQLADLYAVFSRKQANKHYKTRGQCVFLRDSYLPHLTTRLQHYSGLIEQPLRKATVERTQETFDVRGWITQLNHH